MTWTTFHEESAKLADAARVARWRGDAESAQAHSRAAARAEALALREIDPDDSVTYGVIAVSAAALFYKGGEFKEAARIAKAALGAPELPDFAKEQLEEIQSLLPAEDKGAGVESVVAVAEQSHGKEMKADLVGAIPTLRAFAFSLCGNSDRADDLVQETLMKAWVSVDCFIEGTNLTAWLFTILRNIYYSEYRNRPRETSDPDGVMAAKLVAPASQPGHIDILDFKAALQKLPLDQREAMILIGYGMSYGEAATICGCTSDMMKSRINRARTRLGSLIDCDKWSEELKELEKLVPELTSIPQSQKLCEFVAALLAA